MQTTAGRFYYHHDDLGSTAAITNAGGSVQWTYSYDPYGNERNSTKVDPTAPDNVEQFTGELLDPETGLYDLRARLYDPATGRFLQTDPIAQGATDPALSPYAYAANQPTVLTDPSGESVACAQFGLLYGSCSWTGEGDTLTTTTFGLTPDPVTSTTHADWAANPNVFSSAGSASPSRSAMRHQEPIILPGQISIWNPDPRRDRSRLYWAAKAFETSVEDYCQLPFNGC